MDYIKRFINILYIIGRAIFLGLMYFGVTMLLILHCMVAFLIIFPIVIVLQALEYVLWLGIYYIATGKYYHDDYNPILSVYCEFLDSKNIVFKKNAKIHPCKYWYDTIYDKLSKFKIIKKLYDI